MPLQHLRSGTADKRATPASLADGQISINTNAGSPGLFFKNASGGLVKVGPVHVGSTAPNAVPASGGQAGNTLGELWLDTSGGNYRLKAWDGLNWRTEDVMIGSFGAIPGSATAPGIYFSGDSNTGIYRPGADQLSITTNGTERFRFDSTGQLESVSLGSAASPVYSFTNDSNTGIYSPGADQLAVATNGAGRLFITSAGNVGIGTSSPGKELTVNGNAWIGGGAGLASSGVDRDISIAANRTAGADVFPSVSLYKAFTASSATISAVKVQNVGTNTAPALGFFYGTSVGSTTTNFIEPTYTEAMRIDSSGRAGIGTTSPGRLLHVAFQGSNSGASSANGIRVSTSGNDGNDFAILDFAQNSAQKGSVYTNNDDFSIDAAVGSLILKEGGVETARIDANRFFRLAAGSGGIQFNGDTAAANALDDYEEGTFTPTITGQTSAGVGTYTFRYGGYTKIGNRVFFEVYILWSAHTGTGTMRASGLPFASSSSVIGGYAAAVWASGVTLLANSVMTAYVSPGSTDIALSQYATGGGGASFVAMDTAGSLMLSGSYII